MPNNAYRDALIYLLRRNEFYAYMLLQMDIHYTEDVPIAGVNVVDTKMNLFLNPKTYPKFKLPERASILEHEVLHLILQHIPRQEGRNHEGWNIATDLAINSMVKNLPSDEEFVSIMSSYHESRGEVDPGGGVLLPSKFNLPHGKSAEWYYDELIVEISPEELEALVVDGHSKWKESKGTSQSGHKIVVAQATKKAMASSSGNIPGNLVTEVGSLLSSSVNWQTEMRRFTARILKSQKKYTWKRPSRRYPDMKGTVRDFILNLVVAIDTSGSISDKEASLFYGEIDRIYNSMPCRIWIVDCDTKIQSVKIYKPGMKAEIKGRGGTDLRPPFKWVSEQREKFDGLIYLTDSWGEFGERETIPTLWAITKGGWSHMDTRIPWGAKVKLDVRGA